MKRVLIIEDQLILSDLLARIVEDRPFMELIGTFHDGITGLRQCERSGPDVVILDIGLPRLNGIEVLRQIKRNSQSTYVLVFTSLENPHTIRQAIREGADGFIGKNCGLQELEKALDMAESAQPYYSQMALRAIREIIASPEMPSPLDALTDREKQVLQLIAESHSTKEISRLLNLSIGTINTHRWNLMRKLDIHDAAGLTRFAIEQGLVEPGETP